MKSRSKINANRNILFLMAFLVSSHGLCIAQKNFTEHDREVIIDIDTPGRVNIGISGTENQAVHDYDNLNMAKDYCEECFANGTGDGYTFGAVVEYLLGDLTNKSPSVILRINYEYLPARMSNNDYKIPAIVYINEYDYEKVFATMNYKATYELRFFSADILYKINMPGTGLFAFLGPSFNYNISHKINTSFELKEPTDKMLPKPFDWLEKMYRYSNFGRKVVYDEDIVKEGNYTRIGFKAGITFPIKLKWIVFNPFFQFYYSFRNYDSYEESQVNAWSVGADVLFPL